MVTRFCGGAVCGLLLAWILPSGVAFAQGETKDAAAGAAVQAGSSMDPALAKEWISRWKENIIAESRDRYCDRETGEQIADLVSPFLRGYYYGYMATGDREWVDRLFDWADAVLKRGVKEPDGYIGWPKAGGASTGSVRSRYTDNEMGDALYLTPIVLMADEILRTPALKAQYGAKAEEYMKLAEQTFEKWESRGAWRETKEGGLWVVPTFGFDPKTGKWTEEYEQRNTEGFSLPDNKESFVAMWMLAMYDATHKPIYRDRAEKWFRVMRSRMKLRDNGKYFVWNYWEPGGPWDHKPDGSLKHWVGVHPRGRYYQVDVEAITDAYEHGLVFTKEDIARLVATNLDFMWNQQLKAPEFQRIDGEKAAPDAPPGFLWESLGPFDARIRKIFEASHNPTSWGGLITTPQWVARFGPRAEGRPAINQ